MKSDWQRVQSALRGNRGALESLVREHLRPTYAAAFALTGSVAESEEVVQEAFARALEGLERFHRDGRFGAWLVGIVRRIVAGRRRKSARRERALEAWAKERRTMDRSQETAEGALEREEALGLLGRAVARLPEDLRMPLLLYYVENLSTERVADRLDLEPATVRKRLQRARDALGGELAAALGAAVSFLGPSSKTEAAVLACAEGVKPAASATSHSAGSPAGATAMPRAALIAGLALAAVAGALWLGRTSRRGEVPTGPDGATARLDVAAPDTGSPPGLPEGPAEPSSVIPAAQRVDVRGRVVDHVTSRPIPGARVSFLDDLWKGSGALVGRTSTDDSGRFRFEGPVPPQVVRLHLRADTEGYASTAQMSSNPRARSGEKVIRMVPGTPVEGAVLLEDDRPAPCGAVYCFHQLEEQSDRYGGDFERYARLPVDGRGRFRVWISGERGAVLATAPGHVPTFSPPFSPARLDGPVVVRLERGRAFEGRVVDPEGEPVAGASVVASFSPSSADRPFARTLTAGRVQTDDDGRFHLDGLPGFLSLSVAHRRFQSATFDVIPAGKDVILELAPARWLTFVPVLGNGQHAGAATAELSRGRGGSPFASFFASNGVLRSEAIPPGVSRAMLVVPDFLPVEVEWPAGTGAHDLGEIEVVPGLSLDVRVLDGSGRAVSGARVGLPTDPCARHCGGLTDERGEYGFDGLTPGAHELVVQCSGFLPFVEELVLEAPRTVCTVELDPGATLVARIVDRDGAPISGATLRAYDARIEEDVRRGVDVFSSDPWSTSETDADGSVRLAGIPPRLRLWLVGYAGGYVTRALEADPIEAGREADIGSVVLDRGAALRVRVRDETGGAIPWASVTVDEDVRSRWWASFDRRVQCDPSGSAEVTGIPAGVYSVSASSLDRAQRTPVTVEIDDSGAHEVEVVLADAVTYAGVVVYEDGEPLDRGTMWLDFPDLPKIDDFRASIQTGGCYFFKELPHGGPIGVHVLYGEMWERLEAPSAEELPERIAVPHGASLALDVSVAGGGEPPGRLRGTLEYEGRERPVEISFARESGLFVAADLPAGRARLGVRGEEAFHVAGEPQVVELAHGEVTTATVSVTWERPERLVVVATGPGGEAVPGASILLDDAGKHEAARTGADGTAALEWTGELRGTLFVEAPGFAMARVPRPVEEADDGRILVSLVPESVVLVEVRDETGTPADVGHVSITLKEHIGIAGGIYRGAPIRDGAARLDALPAGTYRLRFGVDKVSWGTMDVDLGAGEVREIAFRVPPALELHGRVLHNGRPVPRGHLYFRGHGAGPQFQIDGTGSYRARLFARGKYTVWVFATDEHGEFDRMIDVEIDGGGELDLELRTVLFDGRVVERGSGAPVGKAWLKLAGGEVFKAFTGDDGGFRMPHVEPGKYRWRVFRWVGEEVDDLGKGEIVLQEDTTVTLAVDAPVRP